MTEYQSNDLTCDECGEQAEMRFMYGAQVAVECPECGAEWVIEAGGKV
jgi:ribosomal protein S27E